MSRRVVTVEPSQPIQDLVPYFVEKSFNYIPVVENQRLIGIVSRADMIAALQQLLNQQYVLTWFRQKKATVVLGVNQP